MYEHNICNGFAIRELTHCGYHITMYVESILGELKDWVYIQGPPKHGYTHKNTDAGPSRS